MKESVYQAKVIKELRLRFPDCFILKNDSSYIQGVPDLIILYGDQWAMLEVKVSGSARSQPNQQHYVSMLNEMSFAAFIYPENEEEVFDALQHTFGLRRATRLS
jgi:hypothetical protein